MPDGTDFTPKGEDELRKQVIEEFDLADDEANKPFIDKAVKKEIDRQNERLEFSKKEKDWETKHNESEKKLSKAIEQKAKWRESAKKALELEDDPNNTGNGEPKPTGEPTPNPAPKPAENEELSALKKTVADLTARDHRRQYAHLKDDEYNTVLTVAGGIDRFEETLSNNPMIKSYLETNKVHERISGATGAPSTRTGPAESMRFEEVDLSNPEHAKWLRSDPKRLKEYDDWFELNGSKSLK